VARIRTVKPELFTSERCAECSVTAVMTFIGLFTQADDHGRHRDNAAIIAGVLWPLRSEHTPVHVEDDLQQLADAGLICRYTGCDGKRYLHIVGWYEHQKIDKRGQSRLPACREHNASQRCGPCDGTCTRTKTAESTHRELAEGSPNPPGGLADTSPNAPRALDRPVQPEPTPPAPRTEAAPDRQPAPDSLAAAPDSAEQKTARQEAFAEDSPKAPRNLAEGSAPGSRILDPGSFNPSGRTAPAATITAKDLIGEYVAACGKRPPDDVIGHLGRITKKLLAEGIAVEHVRAGLKRFAEIQGHPSRLPSLVNDSLNPRPAGLARPGFRPNVPAHTAWTNPVDAAAAYAEEL
jgi:hypothetical protein